MLKNKLLASVLIITCCPEASIYDADGRNIFVNTMKQALQSETKEVYRISFTEINEIKKNCLLRHTCIFFKFRLH